MTEPKKRKPRKKYNTIRHAGSAMGAFEGGKSDVAFLKEDIENWKSNMESNSMEHLPKYEEVEACYTALEEAVEKLDEVEWPSNEEGEIDGSVAYMEYRPVNKKRGPPRWMQLSSAESQLEAAKGSLEEYLAEHGENEDETIQTAIDTIQEAIDNMGGVSFPSMF